jgi:hypothetical protein
MQHGAIRITVFVRGERFEQHVAARVRATRT